MVIYQHWTCTMDGVKYKPQVVPSMPCPGQTVGIEDLKSVQENPGRFQRFLNGRWVELHGTEYISKQLQKYAVRAKPLTEYWIHTDIANLKHLDAEPQ